MNLRRYRGVKRKTHAEFIQPRETGSNRYCPKKALNEVPNKHYLFLFFKALMPYKGV